VTARVAVVGDVLLDRDVIGSVTRVCPDAPAPVLDATHESARPGGAGLAAVLLAADGHDVTLVATIGADAAGALVTQLLAARGVRLIALPTNGTTREKVRVRTGDQSLVRIDRGTRCPPAGGLNAGARAALEDCDAVLVCDYGGGVTADPQIRDALGRAAVRRPVVWDPHVKGTEPVSGVRLVTPNQLEAAALAGLRTAADQSALAAAAEQADLLLDRWAAHAVCVTLGARGALVTLGSGAPMLVPAPAVHGGDTCGAGDRFSAAAAAALAEGDVLSSAVQQAVQAASVFVAAGGAASVSASRPSQPATRASGWDRIAQVRADGGTVVATGGCFDLLHAGHVSLLRAAGGLGDCLVVCLNSDDSMRRLKGAQRPLVPEADRAHVLEALECVDAVYVFGEDTPEAALRRLRPDVWVKGGDYTLVDLPEAAVVREWGGQTVVLPYLDGRSTTALIGAIRRRETSTTVKESS
jgi:rfaE bifunctional protein nucleotidyltransferase chain/domain/rfaE bifunctional protein kinase chain/domain